MNREETIAKLDHEQAKVNFAIELDAGRHHAPPKMDFDRFGICKNCRKCTIMFGSYEIKVKCPEMFTHIRSPKDMIYCDDNARVTEVMRKYYD